MSQELPVGNFEWADGIKHFDVMNVPDNGNKKYILEADLDNSCSYMLLTELFWMYSIFPSHDNFRGKINHSGFWRFERLRSVEKNMVNTTKTQNFHVFVLDYFQSTHDLHEDYPVAPETLVIDKSMLSDKQKLRLTEKHNNFQFV